MARETPLTPPCGGCVARSTPDSEDNPMEIYLALVVLNLALFVLAECAS